jgi:purine-nucleoside phosphorylase/catechol 2,3-dioxygenase-like lactoylglutathione lyase family enzyme
MLKDLTRADWLNILGLPVERIPEVLIVRGTRNFRSRYRAMLPFFDNVLEVGTPNGIIEDVLIGDVRGRPIGFACVYGASMASEVVHIFGVLGTRAVIQIGNCGALADDLGAGDLFVADRAYCGEGAARYYKSDGDWVAASPKLLRSRTLTGLGPGKCRTGAIYTTAALFAESEADVERWFQEGFAAVDMETAATYAVAEHFGMDRVSIMYGFDNPRRREHLLLSDTEKDANRTAGNERMTRLALDLAVEIGAGGESGAAPASSGRHRESRQMIGHVALLVRDYDEAIDFFTRRLRFVLIEDTPVSESKRWVLVGPPDRSGTALLLARAATPEQESRVGNQTGGRVFLFLHTDDFWRAYHEMRSRGVAFAEEPRREAFGTVAVFFDLYGNRWDLVQSLNASTAGKGSMDVVLCPMADLTDAERVGGAALGQAVYPPEVAVAWPGRHLEWSAHQWGVFVRAGDGALVCFVGIVVRSALHDGVPVRVGGIGGVKTHPQFRRQGLASRAIGRAIEFFREQPDVAFGVLVCEPHLLDYYGRLGWQEFSGRLLVTQRGEPSEFTLCRVMTLGVRSEGPITGTIDLCGPPW